MATTPQYVQDIILPMVRECIIRKGGSVLLKQQVGLRDTCSTMHTWTLILIDYLLSKEDLSCMYSCASESYLTNSDEYLNKFVNFANKYCEECKSTVKTPYPPN